MSNQCRNCGRDVNNNYAPYTNAYASGNNSNGKNSGSMTTTTTTTMTTATSGSAAASATTATMPAGSVAMMKQHHTITAKVMFGTAGAIKDLREKEKAEKNNAASRSAGRRQ